MGLESYNDRISRYMRFLLPCHTECKKTAIRYAIDCLLHSDICTIT